VTNHQRYASTHLSAAISTTQNLILALEILNEQASAMGLETAWQSTANK